MAVLGSTVDPRLGAVSPAAIQALSQAGAATGQMYQNLGQSIAGVIEDVEYNKRGKKKYDVLMNSADATAKALNLPTEAVTTFIESAGTDLNTLEALEKNLLNPAFLGRAETRNDIEKSISVAEHNYGLSEKNRIAAQEFQSSENEKDRAFRLNVMDKEFENQAIRDERLNNLSNESYQYQQNVLNAAKLELEENLGKLSLKQQKAKFNQINDLEDRLLERKIEKELTGFTEYRNKIGSTFDETEREKIHREYARRFDELGLALPDLSDTLMSVKDMQYRIENNEKLPSLPPSLRNKITEKEYHIMLIAANGGLTFEDMGLAGTVADQSAKNLAQENKNIYEEIRKKIEGEEYSKPINRYEKRYGPGSVYMNRAAALGAPTTLQVIIDDRVKPGFFEDVLPFLGRDPTQKKLDGIMERLDQYGVQTEETINQ